jgi:hypothetical protein
MKTFTPHPSIVSTTPKFVADAHPLSAITTYNCNLHYAANKDNIGCIAKKTVDAVVTTELVVS